MRLPRTTGYTAPMTSQGASPFDNDPGPALAPEQEQEVFVLTRQALREVDRLATEQYAIPSIILMENAAFHLADVALHLTGEIPPPRVLIVCGPGNNGGDGLAVARHLHNAGAMIEVLLAVPPEQYKG